LNYTVNASAGDPFGLGSHIIVNINRLDIIRISNPFNPVTSGFVSIPLLANTPYSIIIENSGNIGGQFGAQFNGSAFTEFDFAVVDANIPEPSSWAMIIIGFFFIGLAVRRRDTNLMSHCI
jgi:hypothetical protein